MARVVSTRVRIPQRSAQRRVGVGVLAIGRASHATAGAGGNARLGVAVLVLLDIAVLEAQVERVLQAAGIELARQVGLVGEALGDVIARLERPVHQAIRNVALAVVGVGRSKVGRAAAVARHVAQLQLVGEVVLEVHRRNVVAGLHEIAALQAIEALAAHAHGLRHRLTRFRVIRDGVIRHAVVLVVVVAQRDAGRRAHAQGQRGRHAPALEVHRVVAARRIALVAHDVQAERGLVGQAPVAVDRRAVVVVRADLRRGFREVGGLGRLADHVDAAARAAPARVDRVRPLDDFDLFQVEGVTHLRAGIADAVQEDAAGGVLATDDGQVAARAAAFACAKRDAGRVAQDVLQRGRGLVLDHLLRHDLHRARGVQQRRRELRRLRRGGLVRRPLTLHAHGRKLRHARIRGLGGGVRADEQRGGRDRSGQGGSERIQRIRILGLQTSFSECE